MKLFCNKLGKYRQLLAWGVLELFHEDGDFMLERTDTSPKNTTVGDQVSSSTSSVDEDIESTYEASVELTAVKADVMPLFAFSEDDKVAI